MLFTYGKGGTLQTSTIPSNNRPQTNTDANLVGSSSHGKPFPMKHWRKQLIPTNPTSSTQVYIKQIDNPSVSILTDYSDKQHVVYNQLISTPDCLGVKTGNVCYGGTNNVRRRATTVLSPSYSSSTKQYLQKRGRTFEQNQLKGTKISGNSYNSTIPSYDKNNNQCKSVIYKPNNSVFAIQGAATSQGYISKLKQDALCECITTDPLKKNQQECCTMCCKKSIKAGRFLNRLL
jgi:hypothetical protein